jgi:chromosomal replication initiator protein
MLKVYTKLNVNEISKELKRNHSTISQSIKKVEQSLLVGNNILKNQLDEIKTKIEEEDLDFNVV